MIEAIENGPFIITDVKKISKTNGSSIKVEPRIALCRYGKSKEKPYCDGAHREIGFKD